MQNYNVTARSALVLIIGDPVSHSLSPIMHNAGYAALGLPYVMAAARVAPNLLAEAITGVRSMAIKALAVTMPHKVKLLTMLDELDSVSKEIGAVNTVVNDDGRLLGFNTDWFGIVSPLERRTSIRGLKIAVLGAGGAAQAAVFAATNRGGKVAVFNRTVEKAAELAKRWGCVVRPIEEHNELSEYDIIINTTSVGMSHLEGESPIPGTVLKRGQIVFDTIYQPTVTKLLNDAEDRGCTVIAGAEMLLDQGLAQFELHTGAQAPREEMERALRRAIEE